MTTGRRQDGVHFDRGRHRDHPRPVHVHLLRRSPDPAHQVGNRGVVAALPQPAVGRRSGLFRRSVDPGPVHAGPGSVARGRRHAGHCPGGSAFDVGGGHSGPHETPGRSIGATSVDGFDALGCHWNVVEERATEFGKTADRNQWRLVGPMHLAETKEQAIEEVKWGLDDWCHYTQKILAVPHFRAAGETFEERVAWVNETGLGVIGTPDEAVEQIGWRNSPTEGSGPI